mmetsp:Transcript_19907/g.33657  ORF Transcript_19907/g.33657 Transcript_19907/m.33657 type:complete len:511 (-) Transcript_19907:52-1584(-)
MLAHKMCTVVKVDVIIAVHNAQETIEETVKSAMHQEIPANLLTSLSNVKFDVVVCCYNDASTDKSIEMLYTLKEEYANNASLHHDESKLIMNTTLLVGTAAEGTSSRGAGYARNQAVKLRGMNTSHTNNSTDDAKCFHFLCILDSDDIMHPTRIAEQTSAMMSLGYGQHGKHLSEKALMGCQFDRIPRDSTWHYATWANSLSDKRVVLEQFRECTLLQPTWFISKSWFKSLGGWLEAPMSNEEMNKFKSADSSNYYRLVHSSELRQTSPGVMSQTLRLAEDTRLFYAHLRAEGTLHLHRTSAPLVSYRHRVGMSQSSGTPRKLLMQLRAKAWEDIVFFGKKGPNNETVWSKNGFAIWGAGRDGKDFLKALSPEVASRVVCFVDVDSNKIEKIKFYDNPTIGRRIPILHFSLLAKNANKCVDNVVFGRVSKEKKNGDAFDTNKQKDNTRKCEEPKRKKQKTKSRHEETIDLSVLQDLPVVVCVAMYRTNGALESNVASIERVEGKDLWHIS